MLKAERGAAEVGLLQKVLKGKVVAQYESGHCLGVRGRGHTGVSQDEDVSSKDPQKAHSHCS